jgi:molybdate transport system substrate-binding protein
MMKMRAHAVAANLAFALLLVLGAGSTAAEIKVASSNAIKTALEELAPQFEKTTEHKVVLVFDAAASLKGRIEKGETFDVVILTAPAIDDLIRQGKLAEATRTAVAKSGAGVAIRKGAQKPDITTTEAFKRTLLEAKSIAYVEQGATGIYLKSLLTRLGIAEQLKDKTKLLIGVPAAEVVAQGEAEIGMTQISEILPFPGAELAGPLPPDIQLYTAFAAAVGASVTETDAAKALIKFLTAPAAGTVLTAKGLEPG